MQDAPSIGINTRRPPDPIGISTSGVERTRRELRRLDPRLDLWWDRDKHLWKVMERVQDHLWSYVFFWRGPEGEYRDPGAVEQMLRRLAQCDWDRQSVRDSTCTDLRSDVSSRRKEILKQKAQEVEYYKKHVVRDYMERGIGVRQTFGPGGHRSRKFYQGVEGHKVKQGARELYRNFSRMT
ncbi:MAG: hypothetical protein GY719_23650 [bacterium]|nr:hypothetical protein [bacterium]